MKIQDAAKAMREHWYNCQLKWPAPYIHCSPGYSHPKCEEGLKLEKEYLILIKEKLNGQEY